MEFTRYILLTILGVSRAEDLCLSLLTLDKRMPLSSSVDGFCQLGTLLIGIGIAAQAKFRFIFYFFVTQGWAAVVANLEDIFNEFCERSRNFKESFRKHRLKKDEYHEQLTA